LEKGYYEERVKIPISRKLFLVHLVTSLHVNLLLFYFLLSNVREHILVLFLTYPFYRLSRSHSY